MREVLGPGTILGYCTNVHAGRTLDEIKSQLETHALAVKRRVSPNDQMAVGLWFPASVAEELTQDLDHVRRFRDWLDQRGLLAFTLNGFPHGDFHSDVVKHDVYEPNWADDARTDYTLRLIDILHTLLPDGAEGSISTLPVAWGREGPPGWADRIGHVVDQLDELFEQTGRLIHLDLEPEPGCSLTYSPDVLTFFHVFRMFEQNYEAFERHLRVCMDICHQAVMFEPPAQLLEWSRQGNFRIGKVQISSGLSARFRGRDATEKSAMRHQLQQFVEPRYLHQTTIGTKEGSQLKSFHDDLPEALAAHPKGGDEWRVHFHVPIFLDRIGPLETTQRHITEFFKALRPEDGIRHFEVETYAWNVLPPELRVNDLAEGIAQELTWVRDIAALHRSPSD